MDECQHEIVSSNTQRGPYCCQCDRPIVGFFTPVLRDTPAGQILWALKQAAQQEKQHG